MSCCRYMSRACVNLLENGAVRFCLQKRNNVRPHFWRRFTLMHHVACPAFPFFYSNLWKKHLHAKINKLFIPKRSGFFPDSNWKKCWFYLFSPYCFWDQKLVVLTVETAVVPYQLVLNGIVGIWLAQPTRIALKVISCSPFFIFNFYLGCPLDWLINNTKSLGLGQYAGVVGVDHYWTHQGMPCVNGKPREFAMQVCRVVSLLDS